MRKVTDNQQTFLILLSNTFYMNFPDKKHRCFVFKTYMFHTFVFHLLYERTAKITTTPKAI